MNEDVYELGFFNQSQATPSSLEEAVLHSVYSSREQRHRRLLVTLLLILRHSLRGLLFSWPLYLMAYAGFFAGASVSWFL